MRKLQLNQSGAVSMLSVMVFSIIITVVATAYVRSVVSQQRNALSYDQATRAYYAAESGVQDAVRAARANPALLDTDKQDCLPWGLNGGATEAVVGISTDFGFGYTCQLVSGDSSEVTGTVRPGGELNAMVKLQPKDTLPASTEYDLVVRWSEQTVKDSSKPQFEQDRDALHPRTQGAPLLSKTNRWIAGGEANKKVHALLRVGVISHPSANFSRASIKQKLLYLNPVTAASASPTLNNNSDSVETQQGQLFTNAQCYRSDAVQGADFGNYSCRAALRLTNYNFATQSVYARIGSVYTSAKYSLELRVAGSNDALKLRSAQATVDVTGKSGNSFRRVQQKIPLQNYTEDSQADAALISAEGICKLFSIGSTTASYSSGCNPLTD